MSEKKRVLVVDDHREMAQLLADQLTDHGYEAQVCVSGREALEALAGQPPDLVITDLRMKEVDGFDVLAAARRAQPPVPVLVVTAFGAVETAVEAMRRGAAHYFTKPFVLAEVLVYVRRALDDAALRAEAQSLRERAAVASSPLVGDGVAMRQLKALVARVAASDAPVLVRGESGTGKELVARAIHEASPRRAAPFVAVNCSALPATLLESELFGHVKGAFTGATGARRGLFVEADGGTLFLDEIGDMAPELQTRLLRVLQDGVVRPVGADTTRATDVRVVAATHQGLEERMKDGRFRQDLFYRLNVVNVAVPPLRERREDIPALVEHFLAAQHGRASCRFSPAGMAALGAWSFPGNVRELENLVARLCRFCEGGVVDEADVHRELPRTLPAEVGFIERGLGLRWTLRDLETEYIAAALRACQGNKTRAAELLGIDVSTLHRRERAKDPGNSPG